MDQNLQAVLELIQADINLSEAEKAVIVTRLKDADKKMTVDAFRIDRGDQLKKTMSVLLEETIEELEQKRKAIEDKNRDLEIESALERVRTVAMGMRTADDLLNICKILFEELGALGFGELRNAMINIVNDEKGSFLNYDFNGSSSSVTHFSHKSHPVIDRQIEMTGSADDAFFEHVLTGDDLADFKAFRMRNGEPADPKLENVSTLYYYFYSIGVGSVGISAFSSLPEEKREVLKRFRNVFDLAYRRYADIQLAESQARESQIELALERVRARTMAMQHSGELAETAFILFQQFKELGENPDQATIGIINEEEHVIEYWVTMYGSQINKVFKFSIDEPNVTNKIYKGWKAKKKSLVIDLSGKALTDFASYRESMGGARLNKNEKRRVINVAFFSKGLINVQSNEERSEESIRLLERFAGVFEQTYTRFLDLQKAEAQVREAQIEAALERTRTQSMIMQHSSELDDTLRVFHQQVLLLGIRSAFSFLWLPDEEKDRHIFWAAWAENDSNYFKSKAIDYPLDRKEPATAQCLIDWKGKDPVVSYHVPPEGVEGYFAAWQELIDGVEQLKPEYFRGGLYYVEAFMKYGCFGVMVESSLSSEESKILGRFAVEFERTYTRFLDLQKAEAQAREAQIELSLERVRASAMAMHKTDQLLDAAELLYRELTGLGVKSMAITYAIMAGDEKSAAYYSINPVDGKLNPVPFDLSHTEMEVMRVILSGWKKREAFSKLVLDEEATLKHQTYIAGIVQAHFIENNFDHPFSVEAFLEVSPKKAVIYAFNFAQGYIFIIGSEHLAKSQEEMVIRFAKVFELTYRRFLDLKQAEEQARESQIQLALERVRARTMSMQRSEELAEAATEMFQQLHRLEITPERVFVAMPRDGERTVDFWGTDQGGSHMSTKFVVQVDGAYSFKKAFKAWEDKEPEVEIVLKDKHLEEHISYVANVLHLPFRRELVKGQRILYGANFSKGMLVVMTPEAQSKETHSILRRFAAVFDQTYTRFLDLKQAEDQARESQIQLALERVRARTMAMQKSEELQEVIQLVFDQLQQLNFDIDVANFALNYKETDDLDLLLAVPHGKYPMKIHVPYIQHPVFDRFNQAKKKEGLLVDTLSKDEKDSFFEHFFKYVPGVPEENKSLIFGRPGFVRSSALMKNTALTIHNYNGIPYSEAENNILLRFGQVFDQTYTRFNDLKQAEEQARESQIQLGLERVRAKAMAMQTSEGLNELIGMVFSELTKLDFVLTRCLIMIFDPETKASRWWMANSELPAEPMNYLVQNHRNPAYDAYLEAWEQRNLKWRYALKGKVKRDWDDFLFVDTELAQLPRPVIEGMKAPEQVLLSASFNNFGCLTLVTMEPLSDEHSDIMLRFAKVFDMCYTRFNDLKQAEEQSRESKIQLALERVRARTMAMQKSEELSETVFILFQQFKELGENPDQATIGIINEEEHVIEYWVTMHGSQNNKVYKFSIDEPNVTRKIYEAWKKKKSSLVIDLSGKSLQEFMAYRENMGGAPVKKGEKRRIINVAFFAKGLINVQSTEARSEESVRLLERFAGVFDGTYTRFLDLKKAEAQVREAQIEASLERVRSKTMAMHNSQDVANTVVAMFDELVKLGVDPAVRSGIAIIDPSKHMELWTAFTKPDGTVTLDIGHLDMNIHPLILHSYYGWENKEPAVHYELVGDDVVSYFKALNDAPDYNFFRDLGSLPERWYNDCFFFPEGCLFVFQGEPMSAEVAQIFKRFTGIFGQTYRRYLDLKKAEAQAKESQIQLALERVRARTMAMQRSEELAETAAVLFQQFFALGVSPDRVFIATFREETSEMECWTTDQQGSQVRNRFVASLKQPSFAKMYKAWKSQKKSFSLVQTGNELMDYISYLRDEIGVPFKKGIKIEQRVQNVGFFSKGLIGMTTPDVQPPEMLILIERFATVFDLAYTRFNDLKLAEEQARESKIEAALEKVRGKALAMYNSADLTSTASMVFTELRKLGINPIRCGVGMMNNKSRKVALYSATTSVAGDSLGLVGWVMLAGHPVLDKIYDSLLSGEDYFPVLKGKQLEAYYGKLLSGLSLPTLPDFHPGEVQYGHFFPFSDGYLYAWAEQNYNETEIRILKRFASVIDLTFRRYIELQKSEASAREAVRAASLDRVRAEIASMRSTEDLDRITPLIWNELTILGIPFIRCGVFIIDEQAQLIYTHLSTADGRAISTFNLPFDAEGIGEQVLMAWREKQVATLHWTAEEFAFNTNNLVSRGTVTSTDRYVTEHPDISLDLHFAPFLQGMLYVGNTSPLTTDELDLVQSLADAFSTAYARYEDFNKLEAAKQQVENTLTDLKATQTKLIQSEKMASLGELTAGIAHEIQNPLNFVNNFSEVNQEMIEELEEELKAGNIAEALALAADIRENELKINHHGKRADGIVKGMLQHSRTGGGEKQPTNINALADEFLRLSYHGLRAKDKEFNAELITQFEPELPKINVIGQDIGRVLLNLFNNAFYAVNQKKKALGSDFKPEVTVTTMTENGQVIVKVKDNGVGMTEHVREKIMQPFFTTKPTGEGTGLGLSLTYDMVVKGHGGTIQVNSVEGEGSEFTIIIPF